MRTVLLLLLALAMPAEHPCQVPSDGRIDCRLGDPPAQAPAE